MLRAQLAHPLHVAIGRHQHAVGARHRFEDERRDRLRSLELDHFVQHRQRLLGRVPAARDAVVGIEHVHDAGNARLRGPTARIAGQCDAARRGAVVRAVPRQDLVTAGRHPRELDRVLVRLGAAIREEEDVDVAGRDRREPGAQPRARLRRHERVGVRQHRRLLLNRADHALVAMADVHAHQLAVEVDEALAFGRPEVDALRAGHGDRIDFRLSGPLEERVLLRQRDHLFAGHCFRCDFGRHLTAFFHNDVGGRSLFLTTKTRKLTTKTPKKSEEHEKNIYVLFFVIFFVSSCFRGCICSWGGYICRFAVAVIS